SRKTPNLFLPCGFQLSPPTRRSTTNALAANPASVTILLPGEDGEFVPLTVPESAFAPLDECIHYQIPAPTSVTVAPRRPALEWEPFEELTTAEPKVEPVSSPVKKRPRVSQERRRQPRWWERMWRTVRPGHVPPPPVAPAPLRVTDAVRQALPNRSVPVATI